MADLSEVAGIVNIPPPESGLNGNEACLLDKVHQEHGEDLQPVNIEKGSPDSGDVAGGEVADGREEVNTLHHLRSKTNESPCSNGSLVGVIVKLPEMEIETNPLLESCLEPCHLEKSQDTLAVSFPMQPKKDNILLIANLESAETLDTMAAQPLLAGGQPEDAEMTGDSSFELLSVVNPPLPTLMAANWGPEETTSTLIPHHLLAGGQPEERQLVGVPQPLHMTALAHNIPNPVAVYATLLEEFPPLEKGRTLKIRDTFEAGVPHHGEGSAWSRNTTVGQAPRDTLATEGPHHARIGANAGPARLNLAGGVEEGPKSSTSQRLGRTPPKII